MRKEQCRWLLPLLSALLFSPFRVTAQDFPVTKKMHHLRTGETREWKEFAASVPQKSLSVKFAAAENREEYTLQISQYDVKQDWKVVLNNRTLGTLTVDENRQTVYLPVPAGVLVRGENRLVIEQKGTVADDVLVGDIRLHRKPVQKTLSESMLHIRVGEVASPLPLPARITLVNSEGRLQTVDAQPGDSLAVRAGFVYTRTGKASVGLPAGRYTVYATRGVEYGVDSVQLTLKPGDEVEAKLALRREVATEGWVGCDTHLHTLTYSGHGDATISERLLTIAGEGLELPVITEHNKVVNVQALADSLFLSPYFTPVAGTELTTTLGHFNLFPVAPGAPQPDPALKSWNDLAALLAQRSDLPVAILNHGRDIHNRFRPFDPTIHLAAVGRRLDEQSFPANAMEIINSGSQQTDRKRLLFDWFGMLNRGAFLTPVGSSDSHDVGRYLVGQSRTYIRCADEDAGRISIDEAVQNFRAGKVMVAFGLLAEILVNDQYGPGDLVPAGDSVRVRVKVSGPAWAQAQRVTLYANGQCMGERTITRGRRAAGLKWEGVWNLPKPKHDLFLVAVAEGPDVRLPFWPIAKPYQPASPEWQGGTMGLSGAVWVDADNNGERTPAYRYAQEVVRNAGNDLQDLMKGLAPYDAAVAVQAASLLQEQGVLPGGPGVGAALKSATESTKAGFREFMHAWKLAHPEP